MSRQRAPEFSKVRTRPATRRSKIAVRSVRAQRATTKGKPSASSLMTSYVSSSPIGYMRGAVPRASPITFPSESGGSCAAGTGRSGVHQGGKLPRRGHLHDRVAVGDRHAGKSLVVPVQTCRRREGRGQQRGSGSPAQAAVSQHPASAGTGSARGPCRTTRRYSESLLEGLAAGFPDDPLELGARQAWAVLAPAMW